MKKRIITIAFVFVIALAFAACEDRASESTGRGAVANTEVYDAPGTLQEDTPEDQLLDLSLGTSVTTNSMTITLDAIEEGPPTSTGDPSYKITVTYENHAGRILSISPFDWKTLEADGTEVGFDMDGRGSFNLVTLPEEKAYTGNVILFKTDNSTHVLFRSTLKWGEITATWNIT